MECPICGTKTSQAIINQHLDKGCPPAKIAKLEHTPSIPKSSQSPDSGSSSQPIPVSSSARPSKASKKSNAPLAERLRPTSLKDYVGQEHLVGSGGILSQLLLRQRPMSMILWGPSGVGKTTFARIIAHEVKHRFVELSATSAGAADIRKTCEDARNAIRLGQPRTIVFLDEIHRFNRAQQDSLLPGVESGDITLIGATTENPSFKLQGALLSRCRVLILKPLTEEQLKVVLKRGIEDVRGANVDTDVELSEEIMDYIASIAGGDARAALNVLEIVTSLVVNPTLAEVKKIIKHTVQYDQSGDQHYDLISAFHKSVRGSDESATLYYLGRMIKGGEDPLYISRRMVRIASEDIGLADDSCLPFAVSTHTAVQQIGLPEADVLLAHCAVKLARATKNVDVYKSWKHLMACLDEDAALASAPVPLHLRNAPTKLMSDIGYGNGYKYNPDYKGRVCQAYLPSEFTQTWMKHWNPSKEDTDND